MTPARKAELLQILRRGGFVVVRSKVSPSGRITLHARDARPSEGFSAVIRDLAESQMRAMGAAAAAEATVPVIVPDPTPAEAPAAIDSPFWFDDDPPDDRADDGDEF